MRLVRAKCGLNTGQMRAECCQVRVRGWCGLMIYNCGLHAGQLRAESCQVRVRGGCGLIIYDCGPGRAENVRAWCGAGRGGLRVVGAGRVRVGICQPAQSSSLYCHLLTNTSYILIIWQMCVIFLVDLVKPYVIYRFSSIC